ncbi:MAG: helix-turn-helix transcriptional regulator [Phycisphaerae bacterium]
MSNVLAILLMRDRDASRKPDHRRLRTQRSVLATQYPPVDADGTCSAPDHAGISIARTLIRDRRAAGLTQQELAKLAAVRQETISRIESGKHTATVRIVDKLGKAIRRASKLHRQTSHP